MRYFEIAVRPRTFGVIDALGNSFSVEMCQFFDKMDVGDQRHVLFFRTDGSLVVPDGIPWFVVILFMFFFSMVNEF